MESERDEAVAKLESKTGLPTYRPIVTPVEYGKHERGCFGLFVANDGYAAYDVSIPDVIIESLQYKVTFSGKLARLIDKDGTQFFEASLERSDGTGSDGKDLYRAMIMARITALHVAIVYKDSEIRWYRSNCVLERDVETSGGLAVSFVDQELISAPPTLYIEHGAD